MIDVVILRRSRDGRHGGFPRDSRAGPATGAGGATEMRCTRERISPRSWKLPALAACLREHDDPPGTRLQVLLVEEGFSRFPPDPDLDDDVQSERHRQDRCGMPCGGPSNRSDRRACTRRRFPHEELRECLPCFSGETSTPAAATSSRGHCGVPHTPPTGRSQGPQARCQPTPFGDDRGLGGSLTALSAGALGRGQLSLRG